MPLTTYYFWHDDLPITGTDTGNLGLGPSTGGGTVESISGQFMNSGYYGGSGSTPGDFPASQVPELSLREGVWPVFVSGVNNHQAVFQQIIDIPEGRPVSVRIDFWEAPHNEWRFHSNGSQFIPDGFPGAAFNRFAINGSFWGAGGGAIGAALLVPGTANVFDLAFDTVIPVTVDSGGGYRGPIYPDQPWVGWMITIVMSTPIVVEIPEEGRTFVGRGGFSPIFGPLEITYGAGFDGSLETWQGTSVSRVVDEPLTDARATSTIRELVGYDSDTNAVGSGGASNVLVMQGFVARWTSVTYVRIAVQGTGFGPTLVTESYPPGRQLICQLWGDDNGLPDTTLSLGIAAVDIDTQVPPTGPAFFKFDPPVVLTPDLVYWVTVTVDPPVLYDIGVLGPSISFWTHGWSVNVPPLDPLTVYAPVIGFAEQSDQTMAAHLDGTITHLDGPIIWDVTIGGEGLALTQFFEPNIFTSPPNGMGVAGRRDPNVDLWPDASPASGWNVDESLKFVPGLFGTWGQLVSSRTAIIDLFVELGAPWVTAINFLPEVYGDTTLSLGPPGYVLRNPSIDPFGPGPPNNQWGPIQVSSHTSGLNEWQWYGTNSEPSTRGEYLIGNTCVARRSDGSIVALVQSTWETFYNIDGTTKTDPILGGIQVYARVGYQVLSGIYPGATYSDFTPIFTGVPISYNAVGCIVDSNDVVHMFFVAIEPMSYTPPGFHFTTQVLAAGPIYHMAMAPDGTVGPAIPWDCVRLISKQSGAILQDYAVGNGCQHPDGGAAIPYVNVNGDLFVAVWPSDINALGPVVQELPKIDNPDDIRFVPFAPHVQDEFTITSFYFIQVGLLSGTLINDGHGGLYFFAFDGAGIQIAHSDGTNWSGYTNWFDVPVFTQNFYGTHRAWQGGIGGKYVPGRDQVGVCFGLQNVMWFEWLPDMSFPGFEPTGAVPSPCPSRSSTISSFPQVIG